ncbi:unnamed protein product (macronuclear) [Paramecium tetraurelia]|uniref:Uncharacterized protein n=1 Tax=Paramecium tetraurelia TaxID=5888 RepID=A0C055_PARTE|nr:uncharacterized protein GSPATT00006025001 [Paramecium tetraurelia]CAK64172.1 unnamed protein product [Paramecium tetraurelia]|eukprot:XP_001431570.1 hypothetical protein (macronuclear) [Paramecium tetraurelia strain d4-2]
MQNIKNVILQLIKYSIVDEQIQEILIQQLHEQQDQLDIAVLAEQIENTVSHSDINLILKPIQDEINQQKLASDKFDKQLKQVKLLMSQLDYQCLGKANKMDIEIQQQNNIKLQSQIQDCNSKIAQILQQQDIITQNNHQLIQDQFLEQIETLEQNIKKSVLVTLDSIYQCNFQKYDKLLQNYEKMTFILETKADQSQFAEIMQSKVSMQQYLQTKTKLFDTLNHLKYMMEAVLQFFEASISEQDSINMRKSDQIKSINLIKSIIIKLIPNEEQKQILQKFNVKLKPTIFKTIQHQRRIKTEIND